MQRLQALLIFAYLPLQINSSLLRSSYLLEEGATTKKIPIETDNVRALGREILSIFGIEEAEDLHQRTRRDKGTIPNNKNERNPMDDRRDEIDQPAYFNSEAADFMKTLYGQIDDERMLAQNHLEMLRNANTIMSFAPKKTFSIGDYTGISFDVLDFAEILPQYAEIRLRFAHAFDGEILLFTKKNGELVEHSSESISKEKAKISLNITKVSHSWITDNQPEIFVKLLDAKGVIFAQDFSIFGIVSYEGISPKSVPQRKKRSTSDESSKGGNVPVNFDPLFAETEVNEKGCRRKGLYVNFNDLGWQDWVIAPEGFQLFLCDGGCSFPLHSKMNATNHAIVQTLVHLLHPQRALPPRCAPSKLSQQKIIFIDDSENVVLKRYQDMIVLECGCQ